MVYLILRTDILLGISLTNYSQNGDVYYLVNKGLSLVEGPTIMFFVLFHSNSCVDLFKYC